ncbi:MAG: hypothetical protein ACKOCK_00500, partial [Chloroflexota bacterium]
FHSDHLRGLGVGSRIPVESIEVAGQSPVSRIHRERSIHKRQRCVDRSVRRRVLLDHGPDPLRIPARTVGFGF